MSDLKNNSMALPSQWPDYIDPKNGEKLLRDRKYDDQLYLKSFTGKAYPIINDIPRILDNAYNYLYQ